MARTSKRMSEEKIERLLAEGRGRGEGADWKPWIEVFDFSSMGRVSRTFSPKFGRTVHLMSDVERNTFYALEWSSRVTGVKEEFPLSRDGTLYIAKSLGIKHPTYPGTTVPCVMTVDFFVDVIADGKPEFEAIDCKHTGGIEDPRAIEKLQITRAYFAAMDIPHRLVLDSTLPMQKIHNIEWIRGGMIKPGEDEIYAGAHREQCQIMAHELANSIRNQRLKEYCGSFEKRHGLRPGMGLRIAKSLMYDHVLICDLNTPDLAETPLASFSCTEMPGKLRAVGGA
jgi:hypothetical protein